MIGDVASEFLRVFFALPVLVLVVLPSAGCKENRDTTQDPVRDEELESAFFSRLNADDVPDVPEPQRLRPCCVFGNDVAVSLGPIPVPGYEVQNVLGI